MSDICYEPFVSCEQPLHITPVLLAKFRPREFILSHYAPKRFMNRHEEEATAAVG